MEHPRMNREIGGDAFHVGDCVVWSAIHYLDSPTDYKAYLPHRCSAIPLAQQHDLVMLSSSRRSAVRNTKLSGWVVSIVLIVGLLLWYFAAQL